MAKTKKKKQKPRHLGRGLQSLMNPVSQEDSPNPVPISTVSSQKGGDSSSEAGVRRIAVESISPNPYQPRKQWNQEQIQELADSIKTNGLIQPVIVRAAEGGYQLIAGERRLRAAEFAGLETIPAIIRKSDDRQMLEWALIENIHRADLNPIERAQAYRNYIDSFSLSQSEAAEKLGENRTVIANHLRILDLPQEVKQMLSDGKLSTGHAKAILSLPTDHLRKQLANRALAGRLSVREVERLVRKHLDQPEKAEKKQKKEKPAHIQDLQERLASRLGTKVAIDTKKKGNKGKITIEFYSLDDFDRIIETIGVDSE